MLQAPLVCTKVCTALEHMNGIRIMNLNNHIQTRPVQPKRMIVPFFRRKF